jgi:hypothetical protein
MELKSETGLILVKRSSNMRFIKLKVNDSGTYYDYFLPSDIRRIKERDGLVSILVSGASGNEWIDLVLETGQTIEDICYLLDCACNGTMGEGG